MGAGCGPFWWSVRVYYEDTDLSGVVYHANYLRFFERARTEWLRALGFSQEHLLQAFGIAFTLADLQVSFRRPARLDDLLRVSVTPQRQRRASFELAQRIEREDGTELTLARCQVACVDAAGFRPRALPQDIAGRIAAQGAGRQTGPEQD